MEDAVTLRPETPPAPVRPGGAVWLFRVYSALFVAALYALGLVHWVRFYNGGNFSLYWDDWKKDYDYSFLTKEALTRGEIPYHMSVSYHGTDCFLGMPETNWFPDVLLLPFVDVVPFFLWHTLLLYTLCSLGCLWLGRRYRLGLIPFTFLFLLFNFNGYITSHLSVGHTMWNGYFLLPFFCLGTLRLLDGTATARTALGLVLVLFGMMLLGAFHHVIWCWLFLLLVVAFNPVLWREVLAVLVGSAALSAVRIGPAAVVFWGHSKREYWAGYPTPMHLLDGLIRMPEHNRENAAAPWIRSELVDHHLGWNEYDMYIGVLSLAALLYFGVYRRLQSGAGPGEYRYRGVDGPLLAMTFLSLNYFYWVIASLPIPLFNAEGVTSRFFIISLLFLIVLAAVHMQRFLQLVRPSAVLYLLLVGGLLQTAFVLAEHSYVWRVLPAPAEGPPVPGADPSIVVRDDPVYVAAVGVSLAASLVVLAAWSLFMLRPRLLPLCRGNNPATAPH